MEGTNVMVREYTNREITTKSMKTRKDERSIQEQVCETRALIKGVAEQLEKMYGINFDTIPVADNGNPRYGSIGIKLKKYDNEGRLKA